MLADANDSRFYNVSSLSREDTSRADVASTAVC